MVGIGHPSAIRAREERHVVFTLRPYISVFWSEQQRLRCREWTTAFGWLIDSLEQVTILHGQDISFVFNYWTLSSLAATRTAAFVLISSFFVPYFPLSFLPSCLTLLHNYSLHRLFSLTLDRQSWRTANSPGFSVEVPCSKPDRITYNTDSCSTVFSSVPPTKCCEIDSINWEMRASCQILLTSFFADEITHKR